MSTLIFPNVHVPEFTAMDREFTELAEMADGDHAYNDIYRCNLTRNGFHFSSGGLFLRKFCIVVLIIFILICLIIFVVDRQEW